jgi:hypothetical protein
MKLSDKSNTYKRPKITKQDIISNNTNLFKEKLQHFIQIHPENYEDINNGIWIRYISNEGKYRSGGQLIINKAPNFFILKNPFNNITWSVNLNNNIIFIKNMGIQQDKMVEKNNLYKLYEAGLVKILDE